MIKISSIIIAKNEETNIRRCIESQRGCIDEIVLLVDEESIDRTYQIATCYSNCKMEGIFRNKKGCNIINHK
jgi:glycosyltransferase involved in cell wall biosynthesis